MTFDGRIKRVAAALQGTKKGTICLSIRHESGCPAQATENLINCRCGLKIAAKPLREGHSLGHSA